jgi:hypothetical protein
VARSLASAWFGGAVGALANSLAVWLLGRAGVFAALGVRLAPPLTWSWLENRLLWGSLWALGLPLLLRAGLAPLRAGLLLSLAPSAAQLLYFAPRSGHGLFALEQGTLSPAVVLLANALWGAVLAWVARASGGAR